MSSSPSSSLNAPSSLLSHFLPRGSLFTVGYFYFFGPSVDACTRLIHQFGGSSHFSYTIPLGILVQYSRFSGNVQSNSPSLNSVSTSCKLFRLSNPSGLRTSSLHVFRSEQRRRRKPHDLRNQKPTDRSHGRSQVPSSNALPNPG